MQKRFPWEWSEARAIKLVLFVCVAGAALAAPSAVDSVLGSHEFDAGRHTTALVISTGVWAYVFRRSLWGRHPMHFLWLGPLLGALNAGTTLGLANLFVSGPGEAMGGLLTGTIFGTFIGGGPLGFVFGAVLVLFMRYSHAKLSAAKNDASLSILRAGSVTLAATACVTAQLQTKLNGPAWPSALLLFVASAVLLVAVGMHITAFLWARRARMGRLAGTRVLPVPITAGENGELVILAERGPEEGAFRTPERELVLGHLPRHFSSAAVQCVVALLALSWAWLSPAALEIWFPR